MRRNSTDEQKIDNTEAKAQMLKAEGILEKYCAPELSTDPETLGLSGAIKKRLFGLTQQMTYLDDAIRFYERGFYVKQDYYNGINAAFMYTQRANILLRAGKAFDAIVSYGHGNILRQKVAAICVDLRKDQAAFSRRGDRQWVLLTEAEAYRGQKLTEMLAQLEAKIEADPPDAFSLASYRKQQKALEAEIAAYEQADPLKIRVVAPPVRGASVVSGVASPSVTEAGVITLDANLDRTRAIKSVEVSCKIEYTG